MLDTALCSVGPARGKKNRRGHREIIGFTPPMISSRFDCQTAKSFFGTILPCFSPMGLVRGADGGRSKRKGVLLAVCCGAVAASSIWAMYSYRAMAEAGGSVPIRMTAEPRPTTDAAAAESAVTGTAVWKGSTSRAPWEPEGCQTIAFFHVPKTGGESLNDLWVDMVGRVRVPWWKDGYLYTGMRITGLTPKEQERYLKRSM